MTPEFSINQTTYRFHEITLRKYLELQNFIGEETQENKFNIVSIITECPVSELRKLSFSDWTLVYNECIFHITFSTTTENIKPIITFEGIRYSLPDVNDITIGEYIDLDLIIQAEKTDRRLNEIAAILYRPIISEKKGLVRIEPYDGQEVKHRAELFLDLPVSAIKSANAFFLRSAKSLQKNLLASLNLKETLNNLPPEDQEHLQNLLQQELGGSSLTEFQDLLQSTLERQLDYPSERSLIGWLGKKLRPKKRNLKAKKIEV
jgi:hypothetical protein